VIAAVSVRGRDASAEWLLPWSSMTGSEDLGRQVRVGYGRTIPGAERRLYNPQRPFAPGWLLCVRQRSTPSAHWGSLTGHEQPYSKATGSGRSMAVLIRSCYTRRSKPVISTDGHSRLFLRPIRGAHAGDTRYRAH